MTVRVLIADDQQLIRAGFRMILGAEPDIEVIGEAGTGAEAVALTRQVKPDVVLMDIRMPDLDGIEATRRILADSQEPKPCVLILTTFDLDEYVYDALRAGASGFLLKDAPEHQLVAGIRTVGHGDALLAPSITRRLIAHFASNHTLPQAPAKLADLTPRELEVLRLLATGLSNGEIADELIVGETTIKTHVTRILMKLGVRNRVQAVVFAYETGLVSPGRHPPASPYAGRPSDIRDGGASRWQLLQGREGSPLTPAAGARNCARGGTSAGFPWPRPAAWTAAAKLSPSRSPRPAIRPSVPGGELARSWHAADRERRHADRPGTPVVGSAVTGQLVGDAGRKLVTVMPLHVITAMYGEQGLRARFAAESPPLRDSSGPEQARRALQLARRGTPQAGSSASRT